MSLSTLVVSEEPEITGQIESLVNDNNDLNYIATSTRADAQKGIVDKKPRVVWIELSPEPEGGFELLTSLKESCPDVHFLVSNVTLEGDLVRRAMNLGAVDFLDSKTWSTQISDVTSRVIAKEIAVQREIQRKEKIQEMLESQKNPRSTDPALKSMRQKSIELDSAESSASMFMVGLIVVLVLAAVYFFFMR